MSGAVHTPGPWRVAYDDHNGQAVVSSEHTEIATCWHHCVGSIEKQMRANARLIAAAPELLAIAEEFLCTLDCLERNGPDLTCADGEFVAASTIHDRAEMLRAAIAKAKGGAA